MISALIHTTLGPLVNGRVHPNHFPQAQGSPNKPRWPAIRYTLRYATTGDICGTPPHILDDVYAQIDIVAESYGAVVVLRDQVIAALESTSPPNTRQDGGFETTDIETKTERITMEFLFQPSSALTASP
jgi:hypothetical protein